MSNDLFTESNSNAEGVAAFSGHELDAFLGKAFEERPIWADLWDSIQDVFFPRRLPPLELTSTPIPVPDPMAVKTDPRAIGISFAINASIAALLLFFVGRAVVQQIQKQAVTPIEVSAWKGPLAKDMAGGGGGGGDHSLVDPSKGKLPPREKNPIEPPQVQTFDKPKLAIEPAINVQKDIQLPDDPNMPTLGMTTGQNVVMAGGQGAGGIGSGSGGGIGSGTGNGFGPGSGGNTGGGLYHIGGGVSAPIPIKTIEPEFSDEARRAKYQGIVLVGLIVDAQGNPQNVHIVRPLGMGLDEKAIQAVQQYKFKPAMKDGKTPVPVALTIEINFRLY